jgi:hypothetical protein
VRSRQTIVAGVFFTPWNLAVQFSHPLRVPLGGPLPYQDAAVASYAGRKIFFYPYGVSSVTSNAEFILQNSSFGTPAGLDLARYRLVASVRRPRGGIVQGRHQPIDVIELWQRK